MKLASQKYATARGFTLFELLVIIAILAVLLTLLLPAFDRLKKAAFMPVDAQNLASIWHASRQFSEEHGNFIVPMKLKSATDAASLGYPTGTTWHTILMPYLGYNPAQVSRATVKEFLSPANPVRNSVSYGPNTKVQKTNQGAPRHQFSISAPSRFIFFVNARTGEMLSNGVNPDVESSLAIIPEDWFGNGCVNTLFLDGHVEKVAVRELKPGGLYHPLFTPQLN